MPPEQNPQHPRRPHHYRGRRNQDRRGGERRPPSPAEPANRDQIDVEQIMREIRARIAERHQVALSARQIEELAARRLEAILDPATVNPRLMDVLRRAAGVPDDPPTLPAGTAEAAFSEAALYESSNGFVRLMRTLLNPILRLFFDPGVLADALRAQTDAQKAADARAAERRQAQAEWNALHFEILRRLVNDIARNDLDAQQLALRVESLAGRVEFNERRVRGLEQPHQPARLPPRAPEPAAQTATASGGTDSAEPAEPGSGSEAGDSARRKRRRRRGRRSGGQVRDAIGAPIPAGPSVDQADAGDGDEPGDDEALDIGAPFDPGAQVDAGAPPDQRPEPVLPPPVVEAGAYEAPAEEPETARRAVPAEPPAAPDPSEG